MNARLWFIFLCGVCVYNLNQLSKRKVLFLLLSPDVNDKVSCGFAVLFDMHFKQGGGKNFTAIEANLQWRFLYIYIIIIIMCFGKQNSQGCQAGDKFVFL